MRWLSLSVSALLLSGCVTIPPSDVCTVAGVLSAGMICANTHSGAKREMDLDASIVFLEAELPTDVTPGRAGAMCMSVSDWNGMKTALEKACRMLGTRCKYAGIAMFEDSFLTTMQTEKHQLE